MYIVIVLVIIYAAYILMGYVEIKFLPKLNEYVINFIYTNILLKNKIKVQLLKLIFCGEKPDFFEKVHHMKN